METFLAIFCDLIPWVVFAVFAVAAAADPVLWLRERRSTGPAPRRAEAARA